MLKWRRFLELPWPEKRWFLLALVLLPALALALRLLGLRRSQALLASLLPFPWPRGQNNGVSREPSARAIARMVRAAANHGPYRANCLKQSLVLWWLLRLWGVESDLRIGVQKSPVGVEAHAWVECDGRPLNERDDVARRFLPFGRLFGSCPTGVS
jgi:Transglutaminase-like superfamily